MRSVMRALLLATLLAGGLAAVAEDNPLKRCKNHYILRQLGCMVDEDPAGWILAAPLRTYHGAHTATLLQDGRVLVAGDTGVPEMTAEIYDAAADSWTLTAPMTRDRSGHTATRMTDGRVLVVGGELAHDLRDWFPFKGTAEIFDPRTNSWSATSSLATPRGGFTATALPTGEVLVVGGYDAGDDSLASTELYDPATGNWKGGAPLRIARFWHTATALPDGNVLIVGGWADDMLQLQVPGVEIYDWKSGSWLDGGSITARAAHSATLLDDGKVLVAGGYTSDFAPSGWRLFWTLDTAQVFDPAAGSWKDAGDIGTPRYGHLAAPLATGGALMIQGTESFNQPPGVTYGPVVNAMSFSESSASWADLGIPSIETSATSVTRLNDGTLLFVGSNHAVLYRY
jgi:WD40 repeat protein